MNTPAADASTTRSCLDRRRAGVLLHPTSFPGGVGNGDLGLDAHRFVDFLADAGFTVWQTLPLGPTNASRSPYQTLSVHAGNEMMISLDRLVADGWLEPFDEEDLDETDWLEVKDFRERMLRSAYEGFQTHADDHWRGRFEQFIVRHQSWLEDYCLFRCIKAEHADSAWWDWPAALRDRQPAAMAAAERRLAEPLAQRRFEQFLFFQQWCEVKHHANERGVLLYGDMPIFVAEDSAETWAQRRYFALDHKGRPELVAGVPPDYFSATGQRWGNPHYRWDVMQADGFSWWLERLRGQLELCDILRRDHFRGFESYWAIPADSETAINGTWIPAPGDALFETLHDTFDPLPLVAEDLGIITPEVEAIRRKWGLPGMKILHFAFGSGPENPYLPHNHSRNYVVYTGTHDNDTTCGWFAGLSPEEQAEVCEYLDADRNDMPWPLIRAALASTANLAVVPLQDLLNLGADHRMNTPGTTEHNWRWRFTWSKVPDALADRVSKLNRLYGRV